MWYTKSPLLTKDLLWQIEQVCLSLGTFVTVGVRMVGLTSIEECNIALTFPQHFFSCRVRTPLKLKCLLHFRQCHSDDVSGFFRLGLSRNVEDPDSPEASAGNIVLLADAIDRLLVDLLKVFIAPPYIKSHKHCPILYVKCNSSINEDKEKVKRAPKNNEDLKN